MAKDVTTRVRFPESTYRRLRHEARRRGVPIAVLVREAVQSYLSRMKDPVDILIGGGIASAGDESVNHDHYLYGWPKVAP